MRMNVKLDKKTFDLRVMKCTQKMKNEGMDVILLTKPSNMFYLTGDGRLCAYTLITSDGEVAIGVPQTDKEDVTDLARFNYITTFEDEVGMLHSIADFFKQFDIQKGVVGLEYTFLTKSMMGMMTHPHAKPEEVAIKDCTDILSQMRMIKEPIEIELMQEAAKIAAVGMEAALSSIKTGITESQIAGEGEYAMRQAGAEGFWRSYVASGIRTRIAHGIPTNRKVKSGDIIMIDLHPIVNNYSSDICRMSCVGKPSSQQVKAHEVYLESLQSTIAKATTGIGMVDLEKTLHGVIQDAGYGDNIFGPPIHGIGINFEEAPLPPGHAFFHGEKAPPPLVKNIPVAIGNCGIYTNTWGVRIEDTVVVGKNKSLVLTNYPYDFE
ncbi:MAG: aminopeptidase P family protein [Candidatus Heimdallarchaeota archaeon]|nr:aminopeptidase P family protein [Candidatus Heimdallarchaeota archaeon]